MQTHVMFYVVTYTTSVHRPAPFMPVSACLALQDGSPVLSHCFQPITQLPSLPLRLTTYSVSLPAFQLACAGRLPGPLHLVSEREVPDRQLRAEADRHPVHVLALWQQPVRGEVEAVMSEGGHLGGGAGGPTCQAASDVCHRA